MTGYIGPMIYIGQKVQILLLLLRITKTSTVIK